MRFQRRSGKALSRVKKTGNVFLRKGLNTMGRVSREADTLYGRAVSLQKLGERKLRKTAERFGGQAGKSAAEAAIFSAKSAAAPIGAVTRELRDVNKDVRNVVSEAQSARKKYLR